MFDDGAVALNVFGFQVVEHLATLTDEHDEGALGDLVFLVLLHQIGEVLDAIGEEGYMSFGASSIFCGFSVLGEDFFFLFFCQIHNVLRLFYSLYFVLESDAKIQLFLKPAKYFHSFTRI